MTTLCSAGEESSYHLGRLIKPNDQEEIQHNLVGRNTFVTLVVHRSVSWYFSIHWTVNGYVRQ